MFLKAVIFLLALWLADATYISCGSYSYLDYYWLFNYPTNQYECCMLESFNVCVLGGKHGNFPLIQHAASELIGLCSTQKVCMTLSPSPLSTPSTAAMHQ
jgi:hypothetical protein